MEFEVIPHRSLGPVRLGVSREEARSELKRLGIELGFSRNSLDYFLKNALQFEVDSNDRVQFIGMSYSPSVDVLYRGIDVFDHSARELFDVMAAADQSGAHQYNKHQYTFPNQILTLYAADSQYDPKQLGTREVWAQVGVENVRHQLRRPVPRPPHVEASSGGIRRRPRSAANKRMHLRH